MGKELTILVADNEDHIVLFQRSFSRLGVTHPIVYLRDGKELINYVESTLAEKKGKFSRFPDYIIMALDMPTMNAAEVLKWMQEHPEYGVIPTIVLGSAVEPDQVKELYALGANSFIKTPGDLSQFDYLLRTILEYWSMVERPGPLNH